MEKHNVEEGRSWGSLNKDDKRIWTIKRCKYMTANIFGGVIPISSCQFGKNQKHNKHLHKTNTNIDKISISNIIRTMIQSGRYQKWQNGTNERS